MDFKAWLQSNNYDTESLDKPEKAVERKHLELAWKAETAPPPQIPVATPVAPTVDDKLAALEVEAQRCVAITEMTDAVAAQNTRNPERIKQLRELRESAIADKKMDVKSYQLALHRASMTIGPMVLVPRDRPATTEAVEAAICKTLNLGNREKQFSQQSLELADAKFKNGLTLLEVVHLCAESNGWHGRSVKGDLKGALRAAFSYQSDEMMAVGPSTYDISGILSNTANKFVREQFNFVESTWRAITAIRAVNDFKTITTYSLTGDLTYEKVAPGGEIHHGTLGETSYTNKADTYAKLLGIDRRDLVNDDLSALSQVGRRLGRGGALKLNDVFWTAFLDNSAFFTAALGNYDDGSSDTLMDLTGINNAYTLFMLLNDPDNKPTGTDPKIVLVPPQLWSSAWTLLMSPFLNLATSTAASTGTTSPWQGMFRLEKSRYLANSSFSGYSTKAWYLLADPNDMPVIETVFLNGAEMPTIETADMDFDRLGIALRGYHDFGVAKQEYRGGVKMKGEA